MTKPQAVILFIEQRYGSRSNLRKAVKNDYCAVQLEWSCFTDMLCRDGSITLKQFSTWLTPFKPNKTK